MSNEDWNELDESYRSALSGALETAHPAVEQAGGDERAAFEAAFAAMGRPVCRADYDQDAYGTPFDDGGWTGWQARAALAQPSPKCVKCGGTGEADSGGVHPWGEPILIPCDCETEKAEPELEPHIPAQTIAEAAIEQLIKSGAKHYQEFHFDLHLDGHEGARPVVVTVAFSDGPSAHELRMKAEQERDAALARVEQQERTIAGMNEAHAKLAGLYEAAQAQHSVPDVCDSKEQNAFEEWASKEGMNMECHPLHWLFLDAKTYSARQGWKAALKYARNMLAAAPVCRLSRSALTEAQMRRLYENSTETENERLGFEAFARLIRRAEAVHQIAAAPGKEVVHE
ncbi:TPA: hypothetical protein ACKQDM_005630 [Pseudomonas aeruginosa]